MSECTHNCESCNTSDCGERTKESFLAPVNSQSKVGKVIAVVSVKARWQVPCHFYAGCSVPARWK